MASDILELAEKRYIKAKDGFQEIYEKAKSDLHFLSDEPYAQWDEGEAQSRTKIGRPALQIDQLSQFIHQVTNDIRMNTPTIKVIPAGMGSDVETAEVIEGRIKAIEYKSNADAAYDMAADFAVKSSIGFIRVDHGYVSDEGFEQEMRIERVVNPHSILIDPTSVTADGSDAKFAFVLEDMTVEDFQEMYPDAAPISFGDKEAGKAPDIKDKITIAEYFYIEDGEEEHGMLEDGTSEKAAKNKKYKRTRKIKKPQVMRCWLSGQDVLEKPSKFPGKYIPIVPVYGEEAWIDGKRNLYSLIRKSKQAQAMYNLWKSLETELLMKQQQAPVQAAVGQMRDFEDNWKNPEKAMVLYYHQTDANGDQAPAPQRLQPPQIPTGIVNAARETVDDIKATMGLYNASIGNRSNETSGIAIERRQQEGDVATFHFGDNLVRSITHVGKIIVCALPEIEDTPRIVQTIGKEDEMKQMGINGAMTDDQKRSYDLTKGSWDVRVITGASFTTQRQEAAAYYSELVGKMPDLMPVIGDLVFKYQDSPGAQSISSRLKKLVDPKLLDESEQEENQPNPEIQALTQEATQVMEAAQSEIQGLQQELTKLTQEKQTAEMKRQMAELNDKKRIAELELENQLLNAKAEISVGSEPKESQPKPSNQGMTIPEGVQMLPIPGHMEMVAAKHSDEMQAKQQEIGIQAQNNEIVSNGINAIANLLAEQVMATKEQAAETRALAQKVSQPKRVTFDVDGNPIGIQ